MPWAQPKKKHQKQQQKKKKKKKRQERDLEVSPVSYSALPKTTKVTSPDPLMGKGPVVLTLWSLILPLQDSLLAVGTEDGQVGWHHRLG